MLSNSTKTKTKPKARRCENCRFVKPDVHLVPEPYLQDVDNTIEMVWLCGTCEMELANEI